MTAVKKLYFVVSFYIVVYVYCDCPVDKESFKLPKVWSTSIYFGCYQANCLKDGIYPQTNKNMTIDKCLLECEEYGKRLAGLGNGFTCYCASYSSLLCNVTIKECDAMCGNPCGGDILQNCGGERTIQIYVVNSSNSENKTSRQNNDDGDSNEMLEKDIEKWLPAIISGLFVLALAVVIIICNRRRIGQIFKLSSTPVTNTNGDVGNTNSDDIYGHLHRDAVLSNNQDLPVVVEEADVYNHAAVGQASRPKLWSPISKKQASRHERRDIDDTLERSTARRDICAPRCGETGDEVVTKASAHFAEKGGSYRHTEGDGMKEYGKKKLTSTSLKCQNDHDNKSTTKSAVLGGVGSSALPKQYNDSKTRSVHQYAVVNKSEASGVSDNQNQEGASFHVVTLGSNRKSLKAASQGIKWEPGSRYGSVKFSAKRNGKGQEEIKGHHASFREGSGHYHEKDSDENSQSESSSSSGCYYILEPDAAVMKVNK